MSQGPGVAIWHYYGFSGDTVFDPESPLNRDDCFSFYRLLRERIEAIGGFCHTIDVCREQGLEPDVVLFFDAPPAPVEVGVDAALSGWARRPEPWLLLFECPAILPHNWGAGVHDLFAKVLTWADPLIDGERYLKFNFPNILQLPSPLDVEAATRGLCTLIASDKHADHPYELYSQRRSLIRWFEQHHPEHFDFYGQGWDAGAYPSYRGLVDEKLPTLGRYWFSVCFENAREFPGYITEKIFDCFAASTVPVYWGPPNAPDLLPADAYIDASRFADWGELYEFLLSVEEDDYAAYLDAAKRFLESDRMTMFTNEGCVDVIVGALERAA
jgi:hypothetical protein